MSLQKLSGFGIQKGEGASPSPNAGTDDRFQLREEI